MSNDQQYLMLSATHFASLKFLSQQYSVKVFRTSWFSDNTISFSSILLLSRNHCAMSRCPYLHAAWKAISPFDKLNDSVIHYVTSENPLSQTLINISSSLFFCDFAADFQISCQLLGFFKIARLAGLADLNKPWQASWLFCFLHPFLIKVCQYQIIMFWNVFMNAYK